MYLFTRQTRLAPEHVVDGMEWAVTITEKVNQVTSLDVGVWIPTMSPGVGTLSFGCAVESLTDLEDAEAKLLADPIFLDLSQQGARITVGGLDDRVGQFLMPPSPDTPANPTHVAVVESRLANGRFQAGIAAGLAIAEKATAASGLPTTFLIGTTGAYGGVVWLTSADSLRRLEEAEQAANGDPSFIALVDEASENYLPGVTTQSIWRRLV